MFRVALRFPAYNGVFAQAIGLVNLSLFGGTPFSTIFSVCSCALVFRQQIMLPNDSLMKPRTSKMPPKNPTNPWAPIDSSTINKSMRAMGPGLYTVGGPASEQWAVDFTFSSSSHCRRERIEQGRWVAKCSSATYHTSTDAKTHAGSSHFDVYHCSVQ